MVETSGVPPDSRARPYRGAGAARLRQEDDMSRRPAPAWLATLLTAALLSLPAFMPRAEAAILALCPFSGGGGDNLTRGFYITNYPGQTLDTVTLSYTPGVEGVRKIRLVARLNAYNGPLLGTVEATAALNAVDNKVTFVFGNVPTTPGSTITFAQTLLEGNASVTYDVGAEPCSNVTQTNGTTAPLSDFRRGSVGLVVTGDPPSLAATITAACPAILDDPPGQPLASGIVLKDYRGVDINIVQLRHRTTSPGVKTIVLVARLHGFGGPVIGTTSVTRNIGDDFSVSNFGFVEDAVVPAGSTVVFSQALTAGTGEVLFDPGYGPCDDVVATEGTTPPLDAATRGHAYLVAIGHVASATPVTVVEYFNASQGHYFMTADLDEIALLDGGGFGSAFVRTGETFLARDGPAPGTDDVCRFFTVAFAPLGSHFYTSYDFECDLVKTNPNWQYEKLGFFVRTPVAGACIGSQPVYRAYNNGQSGAPNHRYTTSLAIYNDFVNNRGWAGEGVVFCAPFPV
jgi:hypothetical protein